MTNSDTTSVKVVCIDLTIAVLGVMPAALMLV